MDRKAILVIVLALLAWGAGDSFGRIAHFGHNRGIVVSSWDRHPSSYVGWDGPGCIRDQINQGREIRNNAREVRNQAREMRNQLRNELRENIRTNIRKAMRGSRDGVVIDVSDPRDARDFDDFDDFADRHDLDFDDIF